MGDLKLVKKFEIGEGFFDRYEKLVKDVVLPYQEKALNDQIEGAEKSHRIENFRMAAKLPPTPITIPAPAKDVHF